MSVPNPELAQLCSALARVFSWPDPEQVELGTGNPLLLALGSLARLEGEPAEHFGGLFDQLWKVLEEQAADGQLLHQAEVEFARLFLVPSEQLVEPYQHAHCGEGAAALAPRLHASYRSAGLEMAESCGDLPDHLATELEFLALLLDTGKKCEARCFVRDHLGAFGSRLAAQVLEHATSPLYQTAAESLARLLSLDTLNFDPRTDPVEC